MGMFSKTMKKIENVRNKLTEIRADLKEIYNELDKIRAIVKWDYRHPTKEQREEIFSQQKQMGELPYTMPRRTSVATNSDYSWMSDNSQKHTSADIFSHPENCSCYNCSLDINCSQNKSEGSKTLQCSPFGKQVQTGSDSLRGYLDLTKEKK